MNRILIEETRIVIEAIAVALDQFKDPKDIDAIRQMIAEADALLAQVQAI